MLSLFINWDVSPELLNIGGVSIRYYGLLFALAFVFGYKVEEKMFKAEGLPMKWLDKLWIYVAIATIIGARLGHCIFYDWAYYSEHPLEMILPVQFTPEFKFTGYQGLASHGAAIGIIAGLWYYSRKVSKKSIFWISLHNIVHTGQIPSGRTNRRNNEIPCDSLDFGKCSAGLEHGILPLGHNMHTRVLLLRRPRRARCPRKRQNVVIRQGIRLLVRLYFIRGGSRTTHIFSHPSACGVDVGDVSQPSEKYRVADRIRVHVVRRNTAGAL